MFFLGLMLTIPYFLSAHIPWWSILASIIILSVMVMSFFYLKQGQIQKAALTTILGSALAFFPVWQWGLPSLTPLWASQSIAAMAKQGGGLSNQQPLLSIGYSEPSLVFFTDTHEVRFVHIQQALKATQGKNGQLIVVSKGLTKQLLTAAHHD